MNCDVWGLVRGERQSASKVNCFLKRQKKKKMYFPHFLFYTTIARFQFKKSNKFMLKNVELHKRNILIIVNFSEI